jgi:hypothetical protein
MKEGHETILDSKTLTDGLIRTLLYEGYALYPYHRSAMKNQKPIPVGVIFPEDYHAFNPHAGSVMQTETILLGSRDLHIDVTVHFLHLRKQTIYRVNKEELFSCGWQAIERNIHSGKLSLAELLAQKK